jgi:hypothetical protein
MNQNNLIILMACFQLLNIGLIFSKDNYLFLNKFSGKLFLILPGLVLLSILWRPL